MVKVQILMSTYNGEKYLKEQIDSILNQKGDFKMSLLVRDDGSSDNTKKILEEYKKSKKLDWYTGNNLGPAKSFLDLLTRCKGADYYAFSDQDDYWDKNKLFVAVSKLDKKASNNGKLYFSALKLVDENLNFKSKTNFTEPIKFEVGIIRNQATGCTIVFDENLRKKVINSNFDYVCMHDSLLYRLALIYDSYIYRDNKSYICYRQHSNNVLGMSYSKFSDFKKKTKRFFIDEREASLTATEFLKLSNIDSEKLIFLNQLSNYKRNLIYKLKLLFSNKYKSGKILSDLTIKIKIIFNRL